MNYFDGMKEWIPPSSSLLRILEEAAEEESLVTPFKVSTAIFAILTFLMIVTIAFEKCKEMLFEYTHEVLLIKLCYILSY